MSFSLFRNYALHAIPASHQLGGRMAAMLVHDLQNLLPFHERSRSCSAARRPFEANACHNNHQRLCLSRCWAIVLPGARRRELSARRISSNACFTCVATDKAKSLRHFRSLHPHPLSSGSKVFGELGEAVRQVPFRLDSIGPGLAVS